MIENLTFNLIVPMMKKVMGVILYHTTQYQEYFFLKRLSLRLLHLFISRACKTDIYQFPIVKLGGTRDMFTFEIIRFVMVGNVDTF